MPTRNDIISLAHRLIGVLSADEVPTADQDAYAGDVLDAVFDELSASQGLLIAWTLDETPRKALMGLAETLASEIAPHYGLSFKPRSAGIARLRAALVSDDRVAANDYADAVVLTQGQPGYFTYALFPVSTNLTGATVTFSMRDEDGNPVIDGAAATIVTYTGTPTVRYDFTAADTKNVGRYRADFLVTYSDASTEVFPTLVKIPVVVTDPSGGSQDLLDPIGEYF